METLVITGSWMLYGAIHSLLATTTVQTALTRRVPALEPAYRLLYNAIAIITLLPLIYLIHHYQGPVVLRWPEPMQPLMYLLTFAALAGFIWSLKYYDMGEFTGIRQWRRRHEPKRPSVSALVISPLHRVVRHPWYCLGLILIWSRNMDTATLISTVAITLYLIVGSRLEERRLVACFGDSYRDYLRRVPGLIPLPGRYLSAAEAEELEKRSRGE